MMHKSLFILFCCFLGFGLSAQQTNCSFGLVLTSAQAGVGEVVTIDVTIRQYNDIIGLQYSHNWNPEKLDFVEVLYNPAVGIHANNFNLTPEFVNQGILNFSYVESTLQGISLADDEVLYSIRFEVLTAEEAQVRIAPIDSYPLEIVDVSQSFIEDYYFIHASVGPGEMEADDDYPVVNWACIEGQSCDAPDLGRIQIGAFDVPALTVAWSNEDGFSANTNEITGLNSGTYALVLTDDNGRVIEGDFFVSSTSDLEVTLAVDADECGGSPDGSITSSISGGSGNYSYLWSNGATTANLSGLEAGVYALTVTDTELDCSVTATTTVAGFAPFIGFFTTTAPSCDGGADGALTINTDVPMEALPLTYAWSNGATTATIDNLTSGPYSVTVTGANACEAVFSQWLNADELEFDAEVTNGTCGNEDGSIEIFLSEDEYTFSWSNGASSAAVFGLGEGDYSVTVTENSTACSVSQEYTLTDPSFSTTWVYDCFEQDGSTLADLTVLVWEAAGSPYTFDWSTGESTSGIQTGSITVPADGTYGVTITSSDGCTQVLDNLVLDCGNSDVHVYLSPPNTDLMNGETVCLDVRVDNFENINGLQFTLGWNENELSYQGIENFQLNGLNEASFGTNLTADGLLTMAWTAPDLINGETLPDGSLLFQLCLEGIATEATNTTVSFEGFPTPMEVVNTENELLNTMSSGAQIMLNGGGSGEGDVTFLMNHVDVTQGQQFCTPLQVRNFADVLGFQLTLSWDPTVLQYAGLQSFNLPNLNASSFGSFAEAQMEGRLRMLWTDFGFAGLDLADNTPIVEVCFTATAEAGTYPLDFSSDLLPLEVVSNDMETVSAATEAGSVTIGNMGQDAVILQIASAGVEPGESVCLPVTTVEFSDIIGMQFSVNWDQDRLDFDELLVSDNLTGLGLDNFNVQDWYGQLSCAWITNILEPVTLDEGTVLFELCFTAQAVEGSAGVIFSGLPTPIEFIRENTLLAFIPINGAVTISEDGIIWPGDTNADGQANNLDLLNIGLGFGSAGPARANPSTQWFAQYADAWAESTPLSLINYRHTDTDGDGVIAANDTLALHQNWGQETDNIVGSPHSQDFLTGSPFYVQPDTVQAGATVRLPIILGVEDEPVENAYGLAFTISYDAEMVTSGSLSIEADGWLGTGGEDLLVMFKDYPAQGRVEVAMVRTDAQEQTGFGTIGELIIIMEDVILRGLVDVEVPFRVEDVTLITYAEVPLPTSPRETTTLVEGVTNTDTPGWAEEVSLHPNPTKGPVLIKRGETTISYLRLLDASGREIEKVLKPGQTIDISRYPAGVYYLHLQTEEGSLYEKLIKT